MDAVAVNRAAGALAAGQRSVVTHEQLLACGLGHKAIAYRRQAGFLHVLFRGVYSYGCGVLPPLAIEQAALLSCGDRSFLSHRTAGALWGLLPDRPPEPDVSVIDATCRALTGLRLHRVIGVDPSELRELHGLRLSSPARAVLETAAIGSSDELEHAFDETLARRLAGLDELRALIARHRGTRGAARLWTLVEEGRNAGLTRSWGERRVRAMVRKAGLPQPEVNVAIGPYRVDFVWRELRLIVEFDGFGSHRGRQKFESDRARDAALKAAGWEVIRFTWRQLRYQPELVLFRLGQIMAALSLRAQAG